MWCLNLLVYAIRMLPILDQYTGMTKRHLGLRVKEHIYSKDSTLQKHISVRNHAREANTCLAIFSYLKSCNFEYSTKIQIA